MKNMTKSLFFVASLLLLLLSLLVAAAEPNKPLAAGAADPKKAWPRNTEKPLAAGTADPTKALPSNTEKPLAAGAADPKKALPRNAELADKQGVPGGYQPIKNISDPYYQRLGKFAVDEHNKQTMQHLRFQKVIDGSSQVVAGINYKLRLTALDGVVSRIYGTIIFKDLSQNLHLKDFFGITRK